MLHITVKRTQLVLNINAAEDMRARSTRDVVTHVIMSGVLPGVALYLSVMFIPDVFMEGGIFRPGLAQTILFGSSAVFFGLAAVAMTIMGTIVVIQIVAHRRFLRSQREFVVTGGRGDEEEAVTANPGTANPGTANPGTANPGMANPGMANPGTANPGMENSGTATPGMVNQGTANQETANPGTANLGMANPGMANLVMANPGMAYPGTANQGTANPEMANPGTANANPGTANPRTASGGQRRTASAGMRSDFPCSQAATYMVKAETN